MEENIVFKKASFGGFDREDVMKYINSISNDFFLCKKKLETEKSSLQNEITKLKKQCEAQKSEIEELNLKIQSMSESAKTSETASVEDILLTLTQTVNSLKMQINPDKSDYSEELPKDIQPSFFDKDNSIEELLKKYCE